MTYPLPPLEERADRATLLAVAARLAEERLFSATIDAMPLFVLVLNPQRQVVAVNQALLEALNLPDASTLIGLRPGEILCCTVAQQAELGCGTAEACRVCGALAAIRGSQQGHQRQVQECQMTLASTPPRCLECEIVSMPIPVDGVDFCLVSLRDTGVERRKQVLERIFFHDVLNTANSIQGLASVLVANGVRQPGMEAEYKRLMAEMSKRLIEEINYHRQLVAAESGILHTMSQAIRVPDLVQDLIGQHRCHEAARERSLLKGEVADCPLVNDGALLRRVLSNLIINACEASRPGDAVTIGNTVVDGRCVFTVHNPGVMPEAIRYQLFRRSFSTKNGPGHGLGAYSARLFTRLMGGAIDFTSSEDVGTILRVELPLVVAAPAA